MIALCYDTLQQEAPAVLYEFAKQLDYFLSYFPYPKPGMHAHSKYDCLHEDTEHACDAATLLAS
jgi:hypothetical protein